MIITHYDLFAGIGGFSLALEEVFTDATIRHIFCEWESFPTAVLKQHWPDGEYWGDIAELVAHTGGAGLEETGASQPTAGSGRSSHGFTIVTGGFPCQPFSHAGRRKGTADDRYQWPNMFAVIRNTKPEWVIAENVRGLVTWNDGMVLETVCADLENEGYEVQPFIIPAVAVGAPHRRDRVWIIAHAECHGQPAATEPSSFAATTYQQPAGPDDAKHFAGADSLRPDSGRTYPDWDRSWKEVAFATCHDAVDDGLPRLVDGVSYSRAKWRQHSLKAYGNGIVPEVAMNIVQAIKASC